MKCRDCEKWGWGDDEGTPVWGWCWKYTSCPDPDIDRSCPDFSPKKPDISTTLSTLQAENKKLRAELENYRKGHCAEGGCAAEKDRDAVLAELEQARAEITRLKHYEDKCHDCPIVCAKAEVIKAYEEVERIKAENKRLKNKLSKLAHLPFDEPGIGERTRLMAENAELRAELEQVKRALAMMWFSYVNSDKEMPHSYETEALDEAERILGPWAECMPKYLRRGPKED